MATAALAGSVLPATFGRGAAAQSAVLFEADFEGVSAGTYPDGWTRTGNSNQEVVTSTAASGSKALKQKGDPGGCWEAISHHPIQNTESRGLQFEGYVRPTSDGEVGCHEKGRGFLKAIDEVELSWYPDGFRLLGFGHDGTIYGPNNASLGSYETDQWYKFRVEYVRSEGSVTQTYWINDEHRGEVSRTAKDFELEDSIDGISITSGDFAVYWDGFRVKEFTPSIEVDIDIKPGSNPNAINPANKGNIPVAIHQSEKFNPTTQVAVDSLRFGDPEDVAAGGGATPAHKGHVEDSDGDTDDDLVVHFPTQEAGFDGGEEIGRLVGQTKNGTAIHGSDSVKIVGGKKTEGNGS